MKLARICSLLVGLCVVACTGPEPSSRQAEKILWCTGCFDHPQPRLSGNEGIAGFRRAQGVAMGCVGKNGAELVSEPLDLDSNAVRAIEVCALLNKSDVVYLRLDTNKNQATPVVLSAPVLRGEWTQIRFDPRLLPFFGGRLRRIRIRPGAPETCFQVSELRILG